MYASRNDRPTDPIDGGDYRLADGDSFRAKLRKPREELESLSLWKSTAETTIASQPDRDRDVKIVGES